MKKNKRHHEKEEMCFPPETVYCFEIYLSQMTRKSNGFLNKGQAVMTALGKHTILAWIEFTQLLPPSFILNTFLLCFCIEL